MFPYVAAYNKSEWNSENCGKCMEFTKENKVIYVTIIDHTGDDPTDLGKPAFNLSRQSFQELFGKNSLKTGVILSDFKESDDPCKCKGNKNCKTN